MLYPPELRAPRVRDPDGRGRGIRTPDPLLPKQMRYQTAPCPALHRLSRLAATRPHPAPGSHGSANDTDAPLERQFAATAKNQSSSRPLRASSRPVPRDIEKSPFPRDRMPAFFGNLAMPATIIDGKKISRDVRREVRERTDELAA